MFRGLNSPSLFTSSGVNLIRDNFPFLLKHFPDFFVCFCTFYVLFPFVAHLNIQILRVFLRLFTTVMGVRSLLSWNATRDGIFKLSRSLGINSKLSIPPAYVAWRAGTTALFLLESVPSPHTLFKNSSTVGEVATVRISSLIVCGFSVHMKVCPTNKNDLFHKIEGLWSHRNINR